MVIYVAMNLYSRDTNYSLPKELFPLFLKAELGTQPSYVHVSKLPIHLLMYDTSFYSKEGLDYIMFLEFISY